MGSHRSPKNYAEYLQSALWAEIRERILVRDSRLCRCCCNPAEVVHHTSYHDKVLAGDLDKCLISLCRECHHAIEFRWNGTKKNTLSRANKALKLRTARLSLTQPAHPLTVILPETLAYVAKSTRTRSAVSRR